MVRPVVVERDHGGPWEVSWLDNGLLRLGMVPVLGGRLRLGQLRPRQDVAGAAGLDRRRSLGGPAGSGAGLRPVLSAARERRSRRGDHDDQRLRSADRAPHKQTGRTVSGRGHTGVSSPPPTSATGPRAEPC